MVTWEIPVRSEPAALPRSRSLSRESLCSSTYGSTSAALTIEAGRGPGSPTSGSPASASRLYGWRRSPIVVAST